MSLPTHPLIRRLLTSSLLAGALAIVAACGGGGEAASPGSATTASTAERATAYAVGPITGFGSVIVNGIRFDDSTATVTDDDERARSREMLKLGMLVEVDGAPIAGSSTEARALRIRFGSQIVGPVSAVGGTSLTVLGQTVDITETTVFDDSIVGGLAGIAVGDVIEVHALYDAASGHWSARRIDSASGATTYKLRGAVANLDTSTRTFELGGQVISFADIPGADLPPSLANGMIVRVRLQTTQANGQWVATAVRTGVRKVEDRPDAALRGTISAFTSAAAFEVNGLKVDAANASFPDGRDGLALGVAVEIKGSIVDGVLVATRVELDDRHAPQRHRFELHGLVSGLDTATHTFKLRGITVGYGASVSWINGTEADLVNGRRVEVRGTPSADRTRLEAVSIAFER